VALEKEEIQELAQSHAAKGDPTGWFDLVYRGADGDVQQVVWADLQANPSLVDWLGDNTTQGRQAVVVGCGLGDDVAFLAEQGFDVTGFDVSPTAIAMAQKRFPEIAVRFSVADLFALPGGWRRGFNLVFECNTIQALSGTWRTKALNAIADLVAPGGVVLVSCRSRESGEKEDAFPLPLDRAEIAGFERAGLERRSLVGYDDNQSPPVAHFFACYRRSET